jgi:hypothetical protein
MKVVAEDEIDDTEKEVYVQWDRYDTVGRNKRRSRPPKPAKP